MDTWTEEVFPWENFHNKKGCCLYSPAEVILINRSPVRDKFWILKCIIRQSKKWKMMKKEKHDSRVKTRKGQSRAETINFFEDSWVEQTKEWRAAIGQHPKPLWGHLPFPKAKFWTLCSRMPSVEFPNLSRWVLTPVKLSYSRTKKKWIILRCLLFKEFIFLEKALEMCHPFFFGKKNSLKIKHLKKIHYFQSLNMAIWQASRPTVIDSRIRGKALLNRRFRFIDFGTGEDFINASDDVRSLPFHSSVCFTHEASKIFSFLL